MPAPTLGVVARPQLPPERLRSVVETADAVGLDELWLWEDCFLAGGVATSAMALSWSSRVKVGLGLVPVPLRNRALAAMELATLCRAFPGRFRFGLGHGVQDWMEQIGARPASPLTLLHDYLVAVRGLLAGETVTSRGSYVHLTEVALDWPPAKTPPILVGASGPKTLALAGAVGDGTILTASTSTSRLRWAREHIDRGGAAAVRRRTRHGRLHPFRGRGGRTAGSRRRSVALIGGPGLEDRAFLVRVDALVGRRVAIPGQHVGGPGRQPCPRVAHGLRNR